MFAEAYQEFTIYMKAALHCKDAGLLLILGAPAFFGSLPQNKKIPCKGYFKG